MPNEKVAARMSARKSRLVEQISVARRALDDMERELEHNNYPNLSGSRGTFAQLISYAGAYETLAETVADFIN